MRKLMMASLALSIALTGCANVGGIPVNTPVLAKTVIDEKAMYAAEALYNVPAQAYVRAVERGFMPPAIKAIVKPKLQAAAKLLRSVRRAYALGDAATFYEKFDALKAFKKDVSAYIPKEN